jgi:hypothetical protein
MSSQNGLNWTLFALVATIGLECTKFLLVKWIVCGQKIFWIGFQFLIYLRWLNQLLFLLNLPTNNPLVFTYMHLLPIDDMLLYLLTYKSYHLQC